MSNRNGLKQKSNKLTMSACIMIAIGGMMGSSIFTLSGVTYAMAGPSALLSWTLAGAVLLLYALNIAELATIFPVSGGIFIYPSRVLGNTQKQRDFSGWIAAWSWLNVSVLGTSFSAICITTYLQEFFPVIKQYKALQLLIPVIWIGICLLLNLFGTTILGKANGVLTMMLILICGIYVFTGLPHVDLKNLTPFVGGTMGASGVFAGIPIAMLAYGSIIAIASIAGEIDNPKRTIPKIMGISVLITVLVYSLILFVTFGMTPVQHFIDDPSRQYYPLAYSLINGLNGEFSWVVSTIPFGAILAITTTMLVLIMDSSRTIMAVSQSGLLPSYFTKIDPATQTPKRALVFVSAIAALITLKPDWIWIIINTGSICCAFTVAIIAFTLIQLRRNKDGLKYEGGFRVPFGIVFPVVTILAVAITLVLLYFGDGGAFSYLLTLLWYAVGFLIFAARYKD